VILYLETNFLVSVALGREPGWEELLASPPAELQIMLPAICLSEA
jgi:hypothetical protein